MAGVLPPVVWRAVVCGSGQSGSRPARGARRRTEDTLFLPREHVKRAAIRLHPGLSRPSPSAPGTSGRSAPRGAVEPFEHVGRGQLGGTRVVASHLLVAEDLASGARA